MDEQTIHKRDWLAEIMVTSGLVLDKRFKQWARYVEDCNLDLDDLKAFEGEWIRPGPLDVPTGHHRLILVCSVHGTRKYHKAHYRLLIMRPDTSLELTGVFTDESKEGHLLWLRDQACYTLEQLKLRDASISYSLPDRVHRAAMGFESALSRLPEEDHLQWYHWLFEDKANDVLDEVITMLQEIREMPRIQLDARNRDRRTEILGTVGGRMDEKQ